MITSAHLERLPKDKFYTAQEIAKLAFEGLPVSESGVIRLAARNKWQSADETKARKRAGRGGGWEYHPSLFPEAAKIDYMERYCKGVAEISKPTLQRLGLWREQEPEQQEINYDFDGLLNEKALNEVEAKVDILNQWKIFREQHPTSKKEADRVFVDMYNLGQSSIECVRHSCVKSISIPTLKRWKKTYKKDGFAKLANSYGAKKGKTIFDLYKDGAMAQVIIGQKTAQPHLTAHHIRDILCADFGDFIIHNGKERKIPSVRSIERFIASFVKDKKLALMKITNPDEFRSKAKFAGHNMHSRIVHFNQKWEIDASPTDILTTDGRYTLYALIDIFSRRAMFHISRTARTDASLALIRRAVLAWGVPVEISTDNGSDFTSFQFKTALKSIGIFQHTCKAFSPDKKGTVERVIGTINRDLMPTLSGFIGHNVTDRKKIEDRKAFSARLGQKSTEAFDVSVSPEQLQEYCNIWAEDKYANRKHSALGMSPREKQRSCTAPIMTIKNERALDLLLCKVTEKRTVTKQGIRLDGELFIGGNLEVGTDVFIRHDPDDAGKIYVYELDQTSFIGEAYCAKLQGVDPLELHAEIKKQQAENIKRDVDPILRASKQVKGADVAAKILSRHAEKSTNVTTLPKREIEHTTENLETASKAIKGYVPVKKNDVEIIEFKEVKKRSRGAKEFEADYHRCNKILSDLDKGESVSAADKNWAENYQNTPDYKAEKMRFEYIGRQV